MPSTTPYSYSAAHTANYSHAIAGLALSESYGMTEGAWVGRIRKAIDQALQCSRNHQSRNPRFPQHDGGWRYVDRRRVASAQAASPDQWMSSGLSVTAWQLMFWRSAKNAGFEIPQQWLDEAIAYVERCFDRQQGVFTYGLRPANRHSCGMADAGILTMSLAGKHDTVMAKQSGDWILRHRFDRYNRSPHPRDYYHVCDHRPCAGWFVMAVRSLRRRCHLMPGRGNAESKESRADHNSG
jgi:hypothetical protein